MPAASLRWDLHGAASAAELNPAETYGSSVMAGMSTFFSPQTVAVVGATDRAGAVARTIVENLKASRATRKASFEIFPINPTRSVVCDLPCFPSVTATPRSVDLAIVVIPANSVPEALESCGQAKIPSVIVISAGFKEVGAEGIALENRCLEIAKKHNIRIIGPNCLGLSSPHHGMNATFAATDTIPGNIAFISQSGAMCTAILDWSLMENVGFSAFISIGSMADVNWGDLIDYLGNDPHTHGIMMYMETIGDAAHFISAARTVAMRKPIMVIKAGQTEAAAQAAASHTGSLAGSHDAFVASMKRAGVMVVDSIDQLMDCTLMLSKQPRPSGPNLLIITNAGGPGVLSTDAAALSGAIVCKLEDSTLADLNAILPPAWSHANPVDVLGDANADLYARTMEIALKDKHADGVLIVLSPQSVTDSTGTAKKVIEAYHLMREAGNVTKPIMCSWMGGTEVAEGFQLLNQNGVPCFNNPDAAARAFGKVWSYTQQFQAMNSPSDLDLAPFCDNGQRQDALRILRAAYDQGREFLTEAESKMVLKAFDIPIAETVICSTVDEAVKAAIQIGFPCVVKLNSETLTHKSDVGGVKLNLRSEQEIREAWNSIKANVDKIDFQHFQGVSVQPMLEAGLELILGSFVDSQFGPLVLFGAGGCMVEIFNDTCLGIPPLTPSAARIQIESTRVFKAIKGGCGERFPGVDVPKLTAALGHFSHMVCELSEYMAECDINPLLALPNRFVALDARIVLRKKDQPKPTFAIRPYPQQYRSHISVGGRNLTVRPTYSGDVDRYVDFHRKLSDAGVLNCYLRAVPLQERITQQFVISVTAADYLRLIALAAIDDATNEIVALACLTRWPTAISTAELKVIVRDDAQGHGLGTSMYSRMLEIAKLEGLKRVQCLVFDSNLTFLKMARKQGMTTRPLESNPKHVQCVIDF